METPKTSFRLTEQDKRRLEEIAREIGCSHADAVRYGLVALKTLLKQGYEFGQFSQTRALRRNADDSVTMFRVAADGALEEWGGVARSSTALASAARHMQGNPNRMIADG